MISSRNVDQLSSKILLPMNRALTSSSAFADDPASLQQILQQWIAEQHDQDDDEHVDRQGFDHGQTDE